MARFRTIDDVQHLVDSAIPEAPSLEYKVELPLASRTQRLETLKDLTGMANGGGGTILYGIDEDRTSDVPAASELVGLDDRRLQGMLEDIARDGVRPPLLAEYSEIDLPNGRFVLAVDVQPSPLGPHMVHAYDQHRYFVRAGRATAPMAEPQVRAAYERAGRAREQRPALWAANGLPIRQRAGAEGVGVVVAGLPEEPLSEIVDLDSIDPAMLRPPDHVAAYLRVFNVGIPLDFSRWADGIHSFASYGSRLRFHRSGAAGVIHPVDSEPLDIVWLARVVNAELVVLAWLWEAFQLRRPIELHLEVERLTSARLAVRFKGGFVSSEDTVVVPPDGPPVVLVVRDEFLPWDIAKPHVRHDLARRLVARVYNAFGRPSGKLMFESGQLYDVDGPLHRSIAGGGVWADNGQQIGFLYTDGTIRRADSQHVGWLDRGAILDREGHTCAVVELAAGRGTPDDFWPSMVFVDPRAKVPEGDAGSALTPIADTPPRPTPSGVWSETNLPTLLAV